MLAAEKGNPCDFTVESTQHVSTELSMSKRALKTIEAISNEAQEKFTAISCSSHPSGFTSSGRDGEGVICECLSRFAITTQKGSYTHQDSSGQRCGRKAGLNGSSPLFLKLTGS